jgi:hypothetical protein
MRGASGIGMGTKIKHLRRTTSDAAGNGLGATIKYLRRTTSAAANNGMSITITPELARCVHWIIRIISIICVDRVTKKEAPFRLLDLTHISKLCLSFSFD